MLGVVLVAAGLKKATGHPLDPLDDLAAVELATGTALFVAAASVMLRVLRVARERAREAAALASFATIPLGVAVSAQVAALAAIVTAGGVAASKDAGR